MSTSSTGTKTKTFRVSSQQTKVGHLSVIKGQDGSNVMGLGQSKTSSLIDALKQLFKREDKKK